MAAAQDSKKLSKKDFLLRLDNNSLNLEKAPSVANLSQEIISGIIQSQKKEFPGFKEEMFYIAYVKSGNYTYFVFYEWYDRGCVFGSSDKRKYEGTKNGEALNDFAVEELKSYEKIHKKYCDKVLGIEVPAFGLTRMRGVIQPSGRSK